MKNSSLLGMVYGILFLLIFSVFLGTYFFGTSKKLSFSYPHLPISFGGEFISFDGDSYSNKQRFDKEFLLSSNNLYQFYLYVKRYPLYIPYIQENFSNTGIHQDMVYLPIAESALRNDVVSSAGAAGIWQFMPDTARRYGLRVDEQVDERYHFEKSTAAASAYLSDLYDIFDDWALVAAAYNRGENGLRRDMQSQGVKSYYDLYLNEETSRYVFRIIAIKYTMEAYFQQKKSIDRIIGGVFESPQTSKVVLGETESLREWSQQSGYNYKTIKDLNRWIRGDSLPEGRWEIQVLGDL